MVDAAGRPHAVERRRARVRRAAAAGGAARRAVGGLFTLDPQAWGFDREADFRDRQMHLVAAAAAAEEAQRMPAQLELARFYLARDLIAEAKGVLDVAALDERARAGRHRAGAARGRQHHARARRRCAEGSVAAPPPPSATISPLWRALAQARQGKWAEAREGFRSLETATATLPLELQRFAFQEAVRAAVEVRDFGARREPARRIRDARRPRANATPISPCSRAASMEGLGRLAEALDVLSRGGGIGRPPGGGARAAARDRAAPVDRRDEARGRDARAGNAHHRRGAATRPKPKRCSCSGASTRRTAAIATRSR